MTNEIGILLDDQGKMTDIFNMTHIDIFTRKEEWEVIQTKTNLMVDTSFTGALRRSIEMIVKELGTCRVLIGSAIIGMPYHIFDRNGFVLCEAEELDTNLLEQIYEDYCKEKEVELEELTEPVPIHPQPVDNDGNFFFDFIKLQKYHPEISSKKALLPFLSHELFQTLTIVCSHIMPWLEDFVKDRGQMMNSKREDGRYVVIIDHKSCRKE